MLPQYVDAAALLSYRRSFPNHYFEPWEQIIVDAFSTDQRAPQDPDGLCNGNSMRTLAGAKLVSSMSGKLVVQQNDSDSHQVALYLLSTDSSCSVNIKVNDYVTGQQLDDRNVNTGTNGLYVKYNVTGQVVFKITNNSGSPLLPGIFWGEAVTGSSPAAVSNLSGSRSGTNINLTWTDNSSNEDGFKIFRKLTTDSTWTLVGDALKNETSYTCKYTDSSKSYNLRVVAYNYMGDASPVDITVN